MSKNIITIGADPEVFLVDLNNKVISAVGLIGGTKSEPKSIGDEGFSVQEDNILAEFNIPPATTKEEFIYNINHCKEYLTTLAELQGLKIDISASRMVDSDQLQSPEARAFSCTPDWNVYTQCENETIMPPKSLRTAAGHIHIGYNDPNIDMTERIIFTMDMILGLESLKLDKDTRRREVYGKAGDFRVTPFGLEYRVLSNFWIKNDSLISWAYDSVQKVMNIVQSNQDKKLTSMFKEDVKKAINTYDLELADQITKSIHKILEKETA